MDVKLLLPEEQGFSGNRWQVTDKRMDEHGERLYWLSTVFLGLDHSGYIYESLAKIGDHEDVVDRYRTRVEAIHGHRYYIRLLDFMVDNARFPRDTYDDEGNRDYMTYEQFDEARKAFHVVDPSFRYRTQTVCCAAPVTHEAVMIQFRSGRALDQMLGAPAPRCSKCKGEISSVYFECFSPEEDV